MTYQLPQTTLEALDEGFGIILAYAGNTRAEVYANLSLYSRDFLCPLILKDYAKGLWPRVETREGRREYHRVLELIWENWVHLVPMVLDYIRRDTPGTLKLNRMELN